MTSFSQRHHISDPEIPITIRDDAPHFLRRALLGFFARSSPPDTWNGGGSDEIARKIHIKFPLINEEGYYYYDEDNFELYAYNFHYDYPPAIDSLETMIISCRWNEVYDIAEYMYTCFQEDALSSAEKFERNLNAFLYTKGIGFLMAQGKIERRGDKLFQEYKDQTLSSLKKDNKILISKELEEAWTALSKRPEPDLTGAITHSAAALECFSRSITGQDKDTLGKIIKNNPDIFYSPLDKISEGLWAVASNKGRHLKEDAPPTFQEAELVFSSSLILINYLKNLDPEKLTKLQKKDLEI